MLEVVACIGTTLLYLAARGPGRALVRRALRRLSALADRVERMTSSGGIRAPAGCSVGRATPGLRTLTVVTAAALQHRPRLVLPALIAGSTVFLQGHLMLGFAVGAAADGLLARARTAAVVVLAAIAVVSAIVWIRRRGRRAGAQALAEAGCPACLAVAVIGDRLAGPDGGRVRPA